MKKFSFIIFFFIACLPVSAKEIDSVTFVRCDGNLPIFILEDREVSFNLLGIEDTNLEYVCRILSNTTSTLVEYDDNDINDAYDDSFVWIWTDEKLLQELMIRNGLGKVSEGNYKYTKELCKIQDSAILKKIGIWAYDTQKGYCENIEYHGNADDIVFEEYSEAVQKAPTEEVTDTLEKIDDALTNITDNNMDKIAKYYLYIFLGLAFVVFVIKEIKK